MRIRSKKIKDNAQTVCELGGGGLKFKGNACANWGVKKLRITQNRMRISRKF